MADRRQDQRRPEAAAGVGGHAGPQRDDGAAEDGDIDGSGFIGCARDRFSQASEKMAGCMMAFITPMASSL